MRRIEINRIVVPWAMMVTGFLGCTTSEDPEPVFDHLVSFDQVWYSTTSATEGNFTIAGLTELLDYVEYDVATFVINYKTTFNGEVIVASGLMGLPINRDAPSAITSIQHGTIIAHDDAPTRNIFDYRFFTSMASSGMIVVIPDFLGFGESEEILHPYYVEEASARPVVDLILAVDELLKDSTITWNGDLFLTGYSEGGYVTMATHKYIQEHPEDGLVVTASLPAAGGV